MHSFDQSERAVYHSYFIMVSYKCSHCISVAQTLDKVIHQIGVIHWMEFISNVTAGVGISLGLIVWSMNSPIHLINPFSILKKSYEVDNLTQWSTLYRLRSTDPSWQIVFFRLNETSSWCMENLWQKLFYRYAYTLLLHSRCPFFWQILSKIYSVILVCAEVE